MNNNIFSSPQAEATNLISEVLTNFTSNKIDLKTNLRKCQLVCELLGWDQQKQWIHQELNGYYQDSVLPPYRLIKGIRKWDIGNDDSLESDIWKSEISVYGVSPNTYEEEADILQLRNGIDWLIASLSIGYKEVLDDTKIAKSPKSQKLITLNRIRIFTSAVIAVALSQIEKLVYDFATSTYVQLKYSNVIRNIWDDYHTQVDKALSQIGLTEHLSAIENNLLSTNSEQWRESALESRNILNDLANYLWRDPRDRYEHLQGKTDDGKLDVTKGKYSNRLSAYLHQKAIFGTQGRFLRDEAERLSISINSLISFASEGHEPLSRQNARSIAIATYILIAEIVTRTDLIPIEKYQ